jgi:hypothetical protein
VKNERAFDLVERVTDEAWNDLIHMINLDH